MAPRLSPSGALVAEYKGGLKVSTIEVEGAPPPGNPLHWEASREEAFWYYLFIREQYLNKEGRCCVQRMFTWVHA